MLHILRTRHDLLHPLPDIRSPETCTRNKQIRYPLNRLVEHANPSSACSAQRADWHNVPRVFGHAFVRSRQKFLNRYGAGAVLTAVLVIDPMVQPALDREGVVALTGKGIAAAMRQHMGVRPEP
jgi:hypothetical protein